MMLRAGLLASLVGAASSAPRQSGCGQPGQPGNPGSSVQLTIPDQGRTRQFQLLVPSNYDVNEPTPVVLYFHGWGGNGNLNWMASTANSGNFIAVGPTGIGGGQNPDGGANSWNGGGSTTSPGPEGPACAEWAPEYCYDSCAARPQGCHPCDWTTCNDDFLFVDALIDWVEESLCIDPTMIHLTGHSNGGQFAWATAARLSHRIASVVPSAGTPHTGFGEGPVSRPVSVMVVHGDQDTTCPANWTDPSSDGWYYEMVPIMCSIWSKADGCSEGWSHYVTSFDHGNGLFCVGQGECADGTDVVRCAFNGGHGMYNNLAGLMWEFMVVHPMPPAQLIPAH